MFGFVLFVLLSLGLANPSQTTDTLGPVAVSEAFPSFGGYTLSGDYLSFKSLLGSKETIIVSYFATWCAPCKKGLPIIEAAVQADPNITAVYIALGEKETEKVEKFAKELNLNSPIMLDRFQKMGERHGVTGEGVDAALPRTFVLDGNGMVQTIFIEEGDDFEKQLSKAISK